MNRIKFNIFGVISWHNQFNGLHRLDGPAMELANGTKKWWVGDLLHRLNGPAIEYANGRKEWHKEGKLHRLDGHAVERTNGSRLYFIQNMLYSELDFVHAVKALNEKRQTHE